MTMRPERAHRLAWCRVGAETVIMDMQGGVVFGLNDRGGEIWHRLDGTVELEELEREAAGARAQLRAFIADLAGHGLLQGDPAMLPGTADRSAGTDTVDGPRITWQDDVHDCCQQFSAEPGLQPGTGGQCDASKARRYGASGTPVP